MDERQLIRALIRACEAAGSQKSWAEMNGVKSAYVSDVINGRRAPGKAILDALGLERVVTYRVKAVEGEIKQRERAAVVAKRKGRDDG